MGGLQIGGQLGATLLYIFAGRVPARQRTNGEGVAEVVGRVRSPGRPRPSVDERLWALVVELAASP